MNFLQLVMFGLSKTPDGALAILRDLEPSQWKLYHDGVLIPHPDYAFNAIGSIKQRALMMEIETTAHDSEGEPFTRNIYVQTRLKNDGTDTIEIDGVPMNKAKFEFHSKPLKKQFVAELGYTDGSGEKHLIKLVND